MLVNTGPLVVIQSKLVFFQLWLAADITQVLVCLNTFLNRTKIPAAASIITNHIDELLWEALFRFASLLDTMKLERSADHLSFWISKVSRNLMSSTVRDGKM